MLVARTGVRGVPHTPEPLAAGPRALHPLRSASPPSHGSTNGVCRDYVCVLPFQRDVALFNALCFYPMRLRSLDCGRLFSAKIASRDQLCATPRYGRFCGTFSAAPARTFMSAQVFGSVAPRVIPKSCLRRHLRRLTRPAGLRVLFGNLALRGFRAADTVLTPARIVYLV